MSIKIELDSGYLMGMGASLRGILKEFDDKEVLVIKHYRKKLIKIIKEDIGLNILRKFWIKKYIYIDNNKLNEYNRNYEYYKEKEVDNIWKKYYITMII